MHTIKERKYIKMKIFKIEEGKAYFVSEDGNWELVNNITAQKLKHLISKSFYEDITFDEETDQNKISNPASRIIYNKLIDKLKSLNENKEDIIREVEQEYKQAFEKYSE